MVSYDKNHIYVNGKAEKIISGAIHYFRVMPCYWQDRLLKLKECGCNCVETYMCWSLHEKKEGVFSGEAVVLTGTLSSFKRSEAQKLIEERGGVCLSSVTAKTTLVLAGEEAGSKLDKAKKLGIKIIDEEEFKQLLNR